MRTLELDCLGSNLRSILRNKIFSLPKPFCSSIKWGSQFFMELHRMTNSEYDKYLVHSKCSVNASLITVPVVLNVPGCLNQILERSGSCLLGRNGWTDKWCLPWVWKRVVLQEPHTVTTIAAGTMLESSLSSQEPFSKHERHSSSTWLNDSLSGVSWYSDIGQEEKEWELKVGSKPETKSLSWHGFW